MVAVAQDLNLAKSSARPGRGYDGVVKVSVGGYYGTGALLYDGLHILTCAHLYDGISPFFEETSILFDTVIGSESLRAESVSIHPEYYSTETSSYDVAVIKLEEPASIFADRYQIGHSNDEVGSTFSFLGYGLSGLGSTGTTIQGSDRLLGENRFDIDTSLLKDALGSQMDWTPAVGAEMAADFDNGLPENDALGIIVDTPDLGLGKTEAILGGGDSGGAAFIESDVIAAVASYGARLSKDGVQPDIDNELNNTFGEISVWQRVSFYEEWIDTTLRESWKDAPESREQVVKEVRETDNGTTLAYFFLELPTNVHEKAHVTYTTRDGTAKAGEDYIRATGKAYIYPGTNSTTIPVEIIGDGIPEEDEFFSLRVYDPVGGRFPGQKEYLEATRVIVDDDIQLVGRVASFDQLPAE